MANNEDFAWMDDVRKKLGEVFAGSEDDLVRVLFYLDEEDKLYYDNLVRPYAPQWNSLRSTINNDRAFKMYATRLAEETKKTEKDETFRNTIRTVYEEMLKHSELKESVEKHQGYDVQRLNDSSLVGTSSFYGLSRALAIMPEQTRAAVVDACRRLITSSALGGTAERALALVNKAGGAVVGIGLSSVYLGFKVYQHIRRWWKGEIGGKRCAKNIIDDTVGIVAGVGGGLAGAALGSLAGPWGTVIGGIAGAFSSAVAANYFIDRLTQYIFGLPQSEALENAYRYLGVSMNASNIEVNRAFRSLCLIHHPDRGGDKEEFFILQCHMSVIRQARGEY